MLSRRIHVDDELDTINVNATCSNVGGDKHAVARAAEQCKVSVALALREVSVQIHGGDPSSREVRCELLRLVLGAREKDATSHSGRKSLDHLTLRLGAIDVENVVRHRLDGAVSFLHCMRDGLVEEAADKLVNAVIQGRGEKEALATLRGCFHDASDAGEEAEVGHVVRLVEHRNLNCIEAHVALTHEVFKATGAGNDDVDAGSQVTLLTLLAHAAKDGCGAHPIRGREGRDDSVNLGSEFTCGREHKRTGLAGASPATCTAEARDEGNRKRERLAGAGATAPKHVATGKSVGKGVFLNGERH